MKLHRPRKRTVVSGLLTTLALVGVLWPALVWLQTSWWLAAVIAVLAGAVVTVIVAGRPDVGERRAPTVGLTPFGPVIMDGDSGEAWAGCRPPDPGTGGSCVHGSWPCDRTFAAWRAAGVRNFAAYVHSVTAEAWKVREAQQRDAAAGGAR